MDGISSSFIVVKFQKFLKFLFTSCLHYVIMVFTKWIEKSIAMWSTVMEYDIDEILIDNVQDWFYTNYHRSCYDNDEDYIDDIRTIIAECDNDIIVWCLNDLIEVYFMRPSSIIGKIAYITEILVKEAKYSLNNFQYSSIKEDD